MHKLFFPVLQKIEWNPRKHQFELVTYKEISPSLYYIYRSKLTNLDSVQQDFIGIELPESVNKPEVPKIQITPSLFFDPPIS